MRVLWLCNIVLPDFSQEFSIKKNVFGGWMTGMLHQLERLEAVDISLCFPIRDKSRMRDGIYKGHPYYSFLCDMSALTYDAGLVAAFENILERSHPDVIHIWGTEYPHTTAMLTACKNKGILKKAVINIQGLVSVYAKHYWADIPGEFITLKFENGTSIEEDYIQFEEHGKCEIESIRLAGHVIGRTDWDRACTEAIHPGTQYHFCDEILRDIFYEYAGRWEYSKCRKHCIFVSQASYPIKGFHYLLQALPIVLQRFPDTQVYAGGPDMLDRRHTSPYGEYLAELIEHLRLGEHVSFLGKLDEAQMVQQYLEANVFVSPSSIENSPNSLREAMLIGTPSVVSYVGGAYEQVDFYENGFLYPHNEPALLAYYICRVFENKNSLCTSISENSVKKILKANDPDENARKTLDIYKEISG